MKGAKTKIALLLGGVSDEREVSLNTGEKIYEALDKGRYDVTKYDPKHDLKKFTNDALAGKFDLVVPALHGPYGEDGRIQGLLDVIGVPYLFSGCLASALAMNKHKAKTLIAKAGVPVPRDRVISLGDISWRRDKDLPMPAVIKPLELGSSVGITLAKNDLELEQGIEKAFKHDSKLLIEEYVQGRELTVTVMGDSEPYALPVIEIIPKKSEWFDYRAKYEAGATDEICPAQIPEKIRDKVQAYAVTAFQAIGCRDVARVDFIWSNDGETHCLEINTIPGMTATSLVPQSARADGMDFGQFLDKLIETGLKRAK